MENTKEQQPCMLGKAVCGTVGLAGLLIRLSAGVVIFAGLGVLAVDAIKKRGRRKKTPYPSQQWSGQQWQPISARRSSGRRDAGQ